MPRKSVLSRPLPTADRAAGVGDGKRHRSRWSLGSRTFLLRAIVPVAVLASWQLYSVVLSPSLFTPPPIEVFTALLNLPFEPGFLEAAGGTLLALAYGFGLAVLLGIPAGLIAGRVRLLGAIAGGYVGLLLTIPMASLVPVIIVLFGIGLEARVAVVFAFALPLLVGDVMAGASSVPRGLLEMGRSFGCGRWQLGRRVIFPAALPEIFAGLRLSAARAVIGMVVAELIVISSGLGGMVTVFLARYQMDKAYAITFVFLIISGLLVGFVQYLESRFLNWRSSKEGAVHAAI